MDGRRFSFMSRFYVLEYNNIVVILHYYFCFYLIDKYFNYKKKIVFCWYISSLFVFNTQLLTKQELCKTRCLGLPWQCHLILSKHLRCYAIPYIILNKIFIKILVTLFSNFLKFYDKCIITLCNLRLFFCPCSTLYIWFSKILW